MEPKERTNQKAARANKIILIRTIVLLCVCGIAIFIPLLYRLWDIAIVHHDEYEDKAIRQQTSDITVAASRGTIYDTNGDVLAISATVYDLILSPRDVIASVDEDDYETKEEYQAAVAARQQLIIDGICSLLEVDREEVTQRMGRTDSAYQVVYKAIEDEAAEPIRTFISDNKLSTSLYLSPTTKRFYPHADLAAQVIGFTNVDGGAYGVELSYNDVLEGTVGRVVTTKNGGGTAMLDGYSDYVDAIDGSDLYLTIDSTIQYYAQQIVEQGIELYDVQNGGICIVIDPRTGAVLADVSLPDYDLNNPTQITDSRLLTTLDGLAEGTEEYSQALATAQFTQWRNKSVNDTYEPGSTFKPVVLAAALQENAVTESSSYYCPGYYIVNGTSISCSNHSGHGSQDLTKAVMNSCNPAFMMIGQALGADKFYDYFTDFGLTALSGIDLPGEQVGSVWTRDYLCSAEGYLSLATASFGQRFTVTPMQMITAFAATINGGYLLQPYVVQEIDNSDGTVEKTEPTVVRQVVSEETSGRVRTILEQVVSAGTGKNAYKAGCRIGGKTGTAEKGTENPDEYIVSFMGFAPANDPQLLVLLAFDTPQVAGPGSNYCTTGYYISGGGMAAPLVGQLIEQTMDYLGIEKQYTAEEAEQAEVTVRNFAGSAVEDAESWCEENGLKASIEGDGDTVTGQLPAAGAVIPGGGTVVFYCGEEVPTDQVAVPDVTGMTLDKARAAMANVNLYVDPTGADSYNSGTVAASQGVSPGTMVDRGSVISVSFSDSSIVD